MKNEHNKANLFICLYSSIFNIVHMQCIRFGVQINAKFSAIQDPISTLDYLIPLVTRYNTVKKPKIAFSFRQQS